MRVINRFAVVAAAVIFSAVTPAHAIDAQVARACDALVARGAEPFRMAPASVQDFVNRDAARWTDLARSIGIKPE